MINRAILIFGVSLFPLSIAHAHWYAGAQLGANFVSVSKKLTYPLVSVSPTTTANYQSAYTGFHGQLFGGRHFVVNEKLGVAIEGDADFFTGSAHYTINNWFRTEGASAKEQLNYGFGLYVLPEYNFNETVHFFAGPGINTTQFAVRSGTSGGSVGVTGNFNEWLTGFGLKAGVKTHLNEKTALLISYQFNQYGSMTKSGLEPLSGDSLTGQYSPYANSIMIGLQYTC